MKVTALVLPCKNSIVLLSSWVPKIFVLKVDKKESVDVCSVGTAPERIEWNIYSSNRFLMVVPESGREKFWEISYNELKLY